ncbi:MULTISPECIES: hypothetical protein [Microbacterium]|uniref:hypothetical protein n=1 Tax=Microbacterium TaxID=33882 RepID=UPI00344ECAA6
MRHDDDRRAPARRDAQSGCRGPPRRVVETARRLVEQQQSRVLREGLVVVDLETDEIVHTVALDHVPNEIAVVG